MFDAIGLELIIYYVFLVIILLVSIGLHEYAHAWTSYKLGDPTPVLQGRLTPNPLKHIDIFGLISVFLIGFGWGKPVVTNPVYYKDSRRGDILVAFAGPIMNLLLAFLGMLIMMIYGKIVGIDIGLLPHSYSFNDVMAYFHKDLVLFFWLLFIGINLALAVFNMIPFPPLDGYRLIKIFWKKGTQWIEKNMTWFFMIFILLIFYSSPIISTYISTVTDLIYRMFFMLFSLIFY